MAKNEENATTYIKVKAPKGLPPALSVDTLVEINPIPQSQTWAITSQVAKSITCTRIKAPKELPPALRVDIVVEINRIHQGSTRPKNPTNEPREIGIFIY